MENFKFSKIILTVILVIFGIVRLTAQVDLTPRMKYPIKGEQYVIDYDTINKVPRLVYYIIYSSKLGSYGRYSFHIEKLQSTAKPEDYSYSGFDKGHIFSSASSNSYTANYESFDMVNIAPQTANFNRGIWKASELFERTNCNPYCYVISGVAFKNNNFISNKIRIPDQFFKVIYNPINKQMISFLFDKDSYGDLKKYVTTVKTIESLIGIDLFYQLPVSDQAILENSVDTSKWNF